MLKELMKLAEKKKGKGEMDPTYKSAKMGVLGDIKKMAEDSMKSDIEGLKKVTVASDDKEGLKEGLDKAKEMVSEMPEHMMAEEDDSEEEAKAEGEAPEMEASEEKLSKLSPEEQALLAKLLKKMA